MACTSSAPAGTTPSGWTTSCAAGPGRQGDPGSSVFFSSWEDDVVAGPPGAEKLPTQTDEDGRIASAKAATLLDHAQRIAEGRLLDVHANTWRYNQLVAQQRAIIVERRDTLLRTPTAREELAERAPERYEELVEPRSIGEEKLEKICRLIMLYHLDRGWADHLAYLADIRESIHLRALGRQNPLDEFHRMAVDAFALAGRRRDRGRPADIRDRRRPSRTSRASICPNWPGRRRRGPTWCTTTRWPTTRCRR